MIEISVTDVLAAEDLGTDHTIDDWPWGSRQSCSMHFWVESHPKRGERFMKQSTFRDRTYKAKKATYTGKVRLIQIDGKMGHVEWNPHYHLFGIQIEDSSYSRPTFHRKEAIQLARHFEFI